MWKSGECHYKKKQKGGLVCLWGSYTNLKAWANMDLHFIGGGIRCLGRVSIPCRPVTHAVLGPKSLISKTNVHTLFAISTKKKIRFPWVKGIKISSSVKANAAAIYNGNSSVDIEFFHYWVNSIFKLREFNFIFMLTCTWKLYSTEQNVRRLLWC